MLKHKITKVYNLTFVNVYMKFLNPNQIKIKSYYLGDKHKIHKQVCMTVANNGIQEFAIVKGTIPKSLKIEFKVFCVKKNVEMSEVIEALIKQWLQTGASVSELPNNLFQEELEEIKGYIPKNLKYQFKVLCKQKKVTMRSVLYALITKLLEMENLTE